MFNKITFSEMNQNEMNKAGYTATEVACGWAGAVAKMVNNTFRQEQ